MAGIHFKPTSRAEKNGFVEGGAGFPTKEADKLGQASRGGHRGTTGAAAVLPEPKEN